MTQEAQLLLGPQISICGWDSQPFVAIFRSTSESRPNSIEGKNVRPYVRPSTKSFFNLNESWYIGRGR